MADDDGGEGVEAADVEEEKLSAEKAREAKQLDAVTDYHEDREIDTSKAQAAINALSSAQESSASAGGAAAAELSKIKVREEDVKLLMDECEVTEDEATLKLRLNNNDLYKALKDCIRV